MDGLNQFFISRILGGVMKHMKRPAFGPLGALHVQHQVLAQWPRRGEQITFSKPTDKLIARAFEETRQGYAVDRVLADSQLAAKFFKRCRQLEVQAPDSAIALRLFRFRKSPRQFVRIPPATAKEPRRDFSPYLFAAEMACTQIKYRFGASVDDILAFPDIGAEFDKLAAQLQPGWTPLDYRLAALHVRKSRYCKSEERSLFESIKVERAESKGEELGSLDKIDIQHVGSVDGIVGLVEKSAHASRFLYIVQAEKVSESVLPFTKQETFDALANAFWSPSLSSINLIVFDIHKHYRKASQALWTKKLIHEKTPVFNWPIRLAA